MPSITPMTRDYPVALKRSTEVKSYFFDTTELAELRPIHVSTSTYVRAVDEQGFSASEWESSDNFSVNLTLGEAKAMLKFLAQAVDEAEAFGFVAESE